MATYAILALLLGTWGWFAGCSWRSHRRFVKQRDVFRCRLRLVSGATRGLPSSWRGRPAWGLWVHDVLLVRRIGVGRPTRTLAVSTVVGSVSTAFAGGGALGPRPLVVRLRLDVGDVVEVAAPESARELVAGPFLVAGVLGVRGTTDRQPPGR